MCERQSDFPCGNQLFILKAKLPRISCAMVKLTQQKRKNSSSQKLLQFATECCSITNSNCKTIRKTVSKIKSSFQNNLKLMRKVFLRRICIKVKIENIGQQATRHLRGCLICWSCQTGSMFSFIKGYFSKYSMYSLLGRHSDFSHVGDLILSL